MRYKSFLTYLVFNGIFLALAVFAGLEFSALPYNGTWGSDAEYYYLAAAGQSGAESCTSYLGYGYVCLFTGFVHLLDLPIAFYFLIGFLYLFIVFRYYRPFGSYTTNLMWFILIFNPIVVWTFLKGVKEGFVILCLLILVKIYGRVRATLGIFDIILFVIAILALSTVKFEAVAFVVLAVVGTEFVMRADNRIRTVTVFACLVIALLFALDQLGRSFPEVALLKKLAAHKELFFNEEISQPDANVNYLFAIFRFLVGPGPVTPITSLFGDIGFYEPTVIGKILIFLGSICWLVSLGLSVLGVTKVLLVRKYRDALGLAVNNEVVFSALMAFFYVMTYAYMYGGMVDTRHRAVVYVLFFPLLAPLASLGMRYFFPDLRNRQPEIKD